MEIVSDLIDCRKCKEKEEVIEELLAIIFKQNKELDKAKEEIVSLKQQAQKSTEKHQNSAEQLNSNLADHA